MTAPAAESLLMTPAEVGEQLRTSARSVYRLIAEGRLVATDIGTTKAPRLRVARTELLAFIRRQAVT